MATKKQTRERIARQNEIDRQEAIRSGLVAQQKERELIEKKKRQAEINRKKPESTKAIKSVAMVGGMD